MRYPIRIARHSPRFCRRLAPCGSGLRRFGTEAPNPLPAYSRRKIVLAAWPFAKIRLKRRGRRRVFKTVRQIRKTAEILQKRRNKQHSAELVAFRRIWKVLMPPPRSAPLPRLGRKALESTSSGVAPCHHSNVPWPPPTSWSYTSLSSGASPFASVLCIPIYICQCISHQVLSMC